MTRRPRVEAARRMPRFQLTINGFFGGTLTTVLPARSNIWKVIEFAGAYWRAHPYESVEIAHVA